MNIPRFYFAVPLLALLLAAQLCRPALAAYTDRSDPAVAGLLNTAIVLTAFGSSLDEARESLRILENIVQSKYPPFKVLLAHTAVDARRQSQQGGENARSLSQILADLPGDDVTLVLVQPLHVVPGDEYEDVRAISASQSGLPGGLKKVVVGAPLISSVEDAEWLAGVLARSMPEERKPGEAVLFAGHGVRGAGGLVYPGLQYYLSRQDPLFFSAVLRDKPDFEAALADLKKSGSKTVWLVPLMAVAGEQARNALWGPQAGSWRSRLEKEGFSCKVVEHGLTRNPAASAGWLRHIAQGLLELRNERPNSD